METVWTMNRKETLSLLNELLAAFESMHSTPILSISKVEDSPDWELQVQWLVRNSEKVALDKIARKYGVTMKEAGDCTFFR